MREHLNKIKPVILCGGKGERLRPITNNIPKPMVKINGKPILRFMHLFKYLTFVTILISSLRRRIHQ